MLNLILAMLLICVLLIVIDSLILLLVLKMLKVDRANFISSLKIIAILNIIAIPLAYLQSKFDLLSISIFNIAIILFAFYLLLKKYFQINVSKIILIYIVFGIFNILLALTFTSTIHNTFFQPFIVSGDAMEPTFSDEKYLLINKFDKNYEKGDIVVYESGGGTPTFIDDPIAKRIYIKRIIALPSEKIEINNGQVLINDKIIDESYIQGKTMINDDETLNYSLTLGNDQYFVMGDNRQHSMDSRISGPVEKQDITGKIFRNK
ncbi:MAG: Signal peptidase I [uncultured bacterium]|nr:MAG: Signal peptidase I [uncultured bacterium]